MEYLWQSGIRHLVTLSPETSPSNYPSLEKSLIEVEEFEAPSLEDVIRFINICQKCKEEQKVGIVLLIYLVTTVTKVFS